MPLITLASLAITMCMIVIVSWAPALGMVLGEHHLQKYVLEPSACALTQPLSLRRQTQKKIAKQSPVVNATCAALSNGDKQIAAGRVVLTTPSMIVLFDPKTGIARRFPLAGITVETVNSQLPTWSIKLLHRRIKYLAVSQYPIPKRGLRSRLDDGQNFAKHRWVKRYLLENGKSELRRTFVPIPKPEASHYKLEELLAKPWNWFVLPNNCASFVEEVVSAGGSKAGLYFNCPSVENFRWFAQSSFQYLLELLPA
jgi:hypothetical protein